MKQTKLRKLFALCFCLSAIAALLLTGCVDEIKPSESPQIESGQVDDEAVPQTESNNSQSTDFSSGSLDIVSLGEGKTVFMFYAVGSDGVEKAFEIHTDKKLVGEALLEVGLVEGEESEYGLYIKTVNGETLDFTQDGKYWAFYIDDAYAMSGVDSTEIEIEKTYKLKAES